LLVWANSTKGGYAVYSSGYRGTYWGTRQAGQFFAYPLDITNRATDSL
jgi:hypothetical protein